MPTLLPVLLATTALTTPARAGEPIALDPPVPVHGTPHGLFATTWDLPPQRPEYMTKPVSELRCQVAVQVAPDGAVQASAQRCPRTMQDAALAAIAGWSFAGEVGDEGTTLTVTFVLRHNERIGSLSLFAEVDPGPEHADAVGRPGLKLVSPARLKKPLQRKLSGKLKRAGAAPADCMFKVRIGRSAELLEHEVIDCPDVLLTDAQERLAKAKWIPGREDGAVREDVTGVVVRYE